MEPLVNYRIIGCEVAGTEHFGYDPISGLKTSYMDAENNTTTYSTYDSIADRLEVSNGRPYTIQHATNTTSEAFSRR